MQREEAVPSDIFPHVYSFLVRFGFLKSAKMFRKESNVPRVVVDTPGLLDFYEAFKQRKEKNVDALQTEGAAKKRKADKQLNKKALKKAKKQTSSSESEEEEQKKIVPVKPISKNSKHVDPKSTQMHVSKPPAKEESSSSSSSDSEPAATNSLPRHMKIAAAVKKPESSSSSDSSSSDVDTSNHVKVSAATKQSTEDILTAVVQPSVATKAKKKPKTKQDVVKPFCRVDKDTEVEFKLADNSFEAKGGARGSWGEKAHHVLKNTKGRSFRHEKTKKKRGSYSGGIIDTGIHSVKFDDSD